MKDGINRYAVRRIAVVTVTAMLTFFAGGLFGKAVGTDRAFGPENLFKAGDTDFSGRKLF
jgi:hypothetical protein